jgi:hypothetical protein
VKQNLKKGPLSIKTIFSIKSHYFLEINDK